MRKNSFVSQYRLTIASLQGAAPRLLSLSRRSSDPWLFVYAVESVSREAGQPRS